MILKVAPKAVFLAREGWQIWYEPAEEQRTQGQRIAEQDHPVAFRISHARFTNLQQLQR